MLNSKPPFARVQSYLMDPVLLFGITGRLGCAERLLARCRGRDLVLAVPLSVHFDVILLVFLLWSVTEAMLKA